MVDPNEIVTIPVDGFYQDVSHKQFLADELDFDGTFDNYLEYSHFMVSLGRAYPEGIPFEYFYQKLNRYRGDKIVQSLLDKGLIEAKSVNEDGDTVFGLTDFGKLHVGS
jgi:hypothetical protein